MKAVVTATLALLLLLGGGACATYTGGAEAIAPAQVQARDGWIAAAPTPTVKQRNLTDCGAATLAMVAGSWQVVLTLDEAAGHLPPPGKDGVRLVDLREGAVSVKLVAFAIAGDLAVLERELAAGRPVVVGLKRPYGKDKILSHYEVVIALRKAVPSTTGGKPKNQVEIVTIDPGSPTSSGWQVRTWSEFEREWKPAGRPALVVLGNAD